MEMKMENELLNEAENIVFPFKLDRETFAYDPLFYRYRNRSKRLLKIQQLIRDLRKKELIQINKIISNNYR